MSNMGVLVRTYQVKRLKFRNGERTSILLRKDTGLPVHEVALFLNRCRLKGRSANTLHEIARSVAFLLWQMDVHGVNLLERFGAGNFLSASEIARFAASTQFQTADLEVDATEYEKSARKTVISLKQVLLRHKAAKERQAVDVQTQATRLSNASKYLNFLSVYVAATLPRELSMQLEAETKRGLSVLKEHIPEKSNQAKLGARRGLDKEDMRRVIETVRPDSPLNPWKRPFVRRRNQLLVKLLFAAGIRRGEEMNLQIGDLNANSPKLQIVRRADSLTDERTKQALPKTRDRELELHPSIMRDLQHHINVDRYAIKAARKVPQLFVSTKGNALSESAIDKIFAQLRKACPNLPVSLVSHVGRHTWNDQFSEVAEEMGLSASVEERARNDQQGWSPNSKVSKTYTRRYDEAKGRKVALALQEKLEAAAHAGE